MADFGIEYEAMELEGTAYWRSQKAEEYPHDTRNAAAAQLATTLAAQMRGAEYTQEAAKFCAVVDFLFPEGDVDTDNVHEILRRWGEYRSRIGFDNFPDSAAEYLNDLLDIARDTAPEIAYLLR